MTRRDQPRPRRVSATASRAAELAALTRHGRNQTASVIADSGMDIDAALRIVVFEAIRLIVLLEIRPEAGATFRVDGLIRPTPSPPAKVSTRQPYDAPNSVGTRGGAFTLPQCPRGPLGLLIELSSTSPVGVTTEWVVL